MLIAVDVVAKDIPLTVNHAIRQGNGLNRCHVQSATDGVNFAKIIHVGCAMDLGFITAKIVVVRENLNITTTVVAITAKEGVR